MYLSYERVRRLHFSSPPSRPPYLILLQRPQCLSVRFGGSHNVTGLQILLNGFDQAVVIVAVDMMKGYSKR